MRRIEQDSEELREIDEALARQATPTHAPREQITEEFDTRELLMRLGQTPEFGESMARPLQALGRLVLRDPPELGWEIIPYK